MLEFLTKSLIQNGMDRCISALDIGKTASEIEKTITFIEQCTIRISMRHGELYIAPTWRIPWELLTRHETMATKLLFTEGARHIYSRFDAYNAHKYFDKQQCVLLITQKLGLALRVATQTLHENQERLITAAEQNEGHPH